MLRLDRLNRKYEQLTSKMDVDENTGPLEATIKHIKKETDHRKKENLDLQRDWLHIQTGLVRSHDQRCVVFSSSCSWATTYVCQFIVFTSSFQKQVISKWMDDTKCNISYIAAVVKHVVNAIIDFLDRWIYWRPFCIFMRIHRPFIPSINHSIDLRHDTNNSSKYFYRYIYMEWRRSYPNGRRPLGAPDGWKWRHSREKSRIEEQNEHSWAKATANRERKLARKRRSERIASSHGVDARGHGEIERIDCEEQRQAWRVVKCEL